LSLHRRTYPRWGLASGHERRERESRDWNNAGACLGDGLRPDPRGEWSPENLGGEWIGGSTGPAAGAKFRGANQNGKKTWSSVATVIDSDLGQRFSFRVTSFGIKLSDRRYEFESTAAGCRVTETWTDLRPKWYRPISTMATGVVDRQSSTRTAVEVTLERLGAAAQAESEADQD
jgi:hypothetical protein